MLLEFEGFVIVYNVQFTVHCAAFVALSFNTQLFILNHRSRRSYHRPLPRVFRKKRSPAVGRVDDGQVHSAWQSHLGLSMGAGMLAPPQRSLSLGSHGELGSMLPQERPALVRVIDRRSEGRQLVTMLQNNSILVIFTIQYNPIKLLSKQLTTLRL